MLKIGADKSHPYIHLDNLYSIIEISAKIEVPGHLVLWRLQLCQLCTFKVRVA